MQCPVDVTESLVEPLRFWSHYAVIPLAGLSRRSAGRWRPWHVMKQTIKILLTNRFLQFLLQKNQYQQAIITLKMINNMFNKTIWILTFFS